MHRILLVPLILLSFVAVNFLQLLIAQSTRSLESLTSWFGQDQFVSPPEKTVQYPSISEDPESPKDVLFATYRSDILYAASGPYSLSTQGNVNFLEIIHGCSGCDFPSGLARSCIDCESYLNFSQGFTIPNIPNFSDIYGSEILTPVLKSLPSFIQSANSKKYGLSLITPRLNTLLLLTTCNHLDTTVLVLSYLKQSLIDADLIIVDDHSTDGTVEYLLKKGYFVISKASPSGLTNSWNIGYDLANKMGYKNLIFLNNDVLVPRGAIAELRTDLEDNALVVPLTTTKGAGHNPAQSIVTSCGLKEAIEDYVNNVWNLQPIQNALSRRFSKSAKRKVNELNRTVPSTWKGKPRFNGFFFGVNLTGIRAAAYNYPSQLFDDRLVMVGQEDSLCATMLHFGLVPVLTRAVFLFHFKSVTVAVAGHVPGQKRAGEADKRDNLTLYHPELSPNIPKQQIDHMNETLKPLRSQVPHLEEKIDNHTQVQTSSAHNSSMQRSLDSPPVSEYEGDANLVDSVESSVSFNLTRLYGNERIYKGRKQGAELQLYVFPPVVPYPQSAQQSNIAATTTSTKAGAAPQPTNAAPSLGATSLSAKAGLDAVLSEKSMSTSSPSNLLALGNDSTILKSKPASKLPTVVAGKTVGAEQMPGHGDLVSSRRWASGIVIAFATSDPVKLPAAGDVFTAYELANSLLAAYYPAVVEVRFLRRGVDWYDPVALADVDVLIVMLDAYDLGKALSALGSSTTTRSTVGTKGGRGGGGDSTVGTHAASHTHIFGGGAVAGSSGVDINYGVGAVVSQPKPALITIAWMRNWFQRWLTRPWIGNYDMLLVTSDLAKSFFDDVGTQLGFQTVCVMGCPLAHVPAVHAQDASGSSPTALRLFEATIDHGTMQPKKFKQRASTTSRTAPTLDNSIMIMSPDDSNKGENKGNNVGEEVGNAHPSEESAWAYMVRRVSEFVKWLNIGPNTIDAMGQLHTETTSVRHLDAAGAVVSEGESYTDSSDTGGIGMVGKEGATGGPDSGSLNTHKDFSAERSCSGRRVQVPVEVLRIAANPIRFSPGKPSAKYQADYVFTGSYYNVSRRIMDFDPDSLPEAKGMVLGKNWDHANVSDRWMKMVAGSVPYSEMPQVYRSAKIVIDDSNHVTAPWASVNSRVFEALSAGSLVLTNGILGSDETFASLLPTFSSPEELSSGLAFYLAPENRAQKKALLKHLRDTVLKFHTYDRRAEELATFLTRFGVVLKPEGSDDDDDDSADGVVAANAGLLVASDHSDGGSHQSSENPKTSSFSPTTSDVQSAGVNLSSSATVTQNQKTLRTGNFVAKMNPKTVATRGTSFSASVPVSTGAVAMGDSSASEDNLKLLKTPWQKQQREDKYDGGKKKAAAATRTIPAPVAAATATAAAATAAAATAAAFATTVYTHRKVTQALQQPADPKANATPTMNSSNSNKIAKPESTALLTGAEQQRVTGFTNPASTSNAKAIAAEKLRIARMSNSSIPTAETVLDSFAKIDNVIVVPKSLLASNPLQNFPLLNSTKSIGSVGAADLQVVAVSESTAKKWQGAGREGELRDGSAGKIASQQGMIPLQLQPQQQQLPTSSCLCVGVRTYEAHNGWVEVLLRSLVAQHARSTHSLHVDMQLFIIDTERASSSFSQILAATVDRINSELGRVQAHVLWDNTAEPRRHKNSFYGYDATDQLLTMMLSVSQCDWIMLTNGDNVYNGAWFDSVAPALLHNRVDIVGWDFVTHHKREGHQQQVIRVALKRKFVDLGSVAVRASLYQQSGARFLPESLFTGDLFARDFHAIDQIQRFARTSGVRLVHRCLMFHQ